MMSIAYTKNFTCFNEENYIISCTISLNSSYITINTIDGKKFSKLSNGFRKLPKFNITQSIMSISYKKNLWSETPIRTSLWIIISKNTSQFYETSSEILHFVRDIRGNFCKTFSIFFYRLPVCYHDIITNFMDFWLLLIFVEFKIYSSTSHTVPFRDQDVQIFLSIDWQCLKLD